MNSTIYNYLYSSRGKFIYNDTINITGDKRKNWLFGNQYRHSQYTIYVDLLKAHYT